MATRPAAKLHHKSPPAGGNPAIAITGTAAASSSSLSATSSLAAAANASGGLSNSTSLNLHNVSGGRGSTDTPPPGLGATVSGGATTATTTTTAGGKRISPNTGTSGSGSSNNPRNLRETSMNLNATFSGNFSPQRGSSSVSSAAAAVSSLSALAATGGLSSSLSPSASGGLLLGSSQQLLPRKQAYFVMDSIKVKRIGIISNDLLENKLVKFDTVTNTVTAVHVPKNAAAVVAASAAGAETGAGFSSSTPDKKQQHATMTSSSATTGAASENNNNNNSKHYAAAAASAPSSLQFSEVHVVHDPLGAAAEVQLEVDKFFETGIPLVGSDSLPDADALIVVSAGPDGKTAATVALSAVETGARYMAHRSLCAHISCTVIHGNMSDMLRGQREEGDEGCDDDTSARVGDEKNGANDSKKRKSLAELVPANVTMADMLEHGPTKHHRPFAVSEPCDPFWDRYSPRFHQRIGICSSAGVDLDDKLATLKVQAEDQIVKNYNRAVAFIFFIDGIHFRDGFHRFTKSHNNTLHGDSSSPTAASAAASGGGGAAAPSQHAANSLFFSRTTVLVTQFSHIANTLIGNTANLPETALAQPWSSCLRHLGAEIHHVLSVVACVPDASSLHSAHTVSSVDDLNFDVSSCSGEAAMAKDSAINDLKRGFGVAQALSKAAASNNCRDPLTDHVYPKRTHIKLPEYVATLKRLHDDQTNEQKTRHCIAKSSLQFLATQVQHSSSPEDAASMAQYLSGDNREKFAAIFRAAFLKKSKAPRESAAGGGGSGGNNNNNNNNNAGFAEKKSSGTSDSFKQQQEQQKLTPEQMLAIASAEFGSGGSATFSAAGGAGGKDAAKLRQQNEALSLIRERLEFDLAKLDKETKRLRSELSVSQTRRKRIERELSDAQGRALNSETSAQKVRTEANQECLEMRQKLVNMQLQLDVLGRCNEELSAKMDVGRVEAQRALQAANEAHERRFRELQAELSIAHHEKLVLQAALEEHTRRIHNFEEQGVRADVEKRELMDQLADSANRIERAQTDAKRVVERSNRARRAEREEYLKLVESGRCATEELITFEDLRVDKICASESLYRSGKNGVRQWLSAIGQEQYAGVFDAAGFADVLSVANVKDDDLQQMRILSGHRRKILACAAELKAHLHLATSKRHTMMPPPAADGSSGGLVQLVANLRQWMRDFEAVVRADAQDEEVFLAQQQQFLMGGGEQLY